MLRHRSLGEGRGQSHLRLLGLAALILLGGRSAGAVEPAAPDDAFVIDHCATCHDGASKKGRLDLTTLAFAPNDPANLAVWIKVHDRVKAGEMPPKAEERPDPARQKEFVEGLARSIASAEQSALAGEGRSVQRRLNRYEYENALRDLLGVPWAQIASRLPEDGEAYHFNKSAEALDVSYLQLARFMDSADYAMRQAMARHLAHPAKATRRLYARDEPSLRNWVSRENGTLPDRLSFPVLDWSPSLTCAGRAPATSPETRVAARRSAGCRASSATQAATAGTAGGRRSRHATSCGSPGTRFVAGVRVACWPSRRPGGREAPVYHTPLWHRPNLDEVYPGRRNEPIGIYVPGAARPAQSGVARLHAEADDERGRRLSDGE